MNRGEKHVTYLGEIERRGRNPGVRTIITVSESELCERVKGI